MSGFWDKLYEPTGHTPQEVEAIRFNVFKEQHKHLSSAVKEFAYDRMHSHGIGVTEEYEDTLWRMLIPALEAEGMRVPEESLQIALVMSKKEKGL
jgi:hypothetical protein